MRLSSVCVYCGSSQGSSPLYRQQAEALGALLADRDLALVYGGGAVGLMGTVADAALAAKGRVHGVIPERLVDAELGHPGLTSLEVVPDMHSRKARMAELADAFVALPGGFGTFEELFEALTWAQLGFHQKPVGLLNIDGFYDPLLTFVDHAIAQGFVHPDYRRLLLVADSPEALLHALEQAPRDIKAKWAK